MDFFGGHFEPPLCGVDNLGHIPSIHDNESQRKSRSKFRDCSEIGDRIEAATALCIAISKCEPEDAAYIMSGVLAAMRAGMPGAPFLGLMDEARSWAAVATRDELKAYLAVCFAALGPRDRAAFLAYAQRGAM